MGGIAFARKRLEHQLPAPVVLGDKVLQALLDRHQDGDPYGDREDVGDRGVRPDQIAEIRDHQMLCETVDEDEESGQHGVQRSPADDESDIEEAVLDDGDADDGVEGVDQEHPQREKDGHVEAQDNPILTMANVMTDSPAVMYCACRFCSGSVAFAAN